MLRCTRRSLVTKWQQAASTLQPEKILPPGLRESADIYHNVDVAAFYGDKVLGAAVALAQQRAVGDGEHTVGSLTRLQSIATSNEFLKSNIATILPQHAQLSESASSAHDIGTMVEAAVNAVHTKGDVYAIDDLAQWLVQTAREMDSLHGAFDNAKGRLLEMGGTVTSKRVGGPEHKPVFEAVAQLAMARVSTTEQGSKRFVEQQVSRRLLRSLSDADPQKLC
jgi:dsRNA-specific ribonuclease